MPPPKMSKIKYLHPLCNKTAHYPKPQQNQKNSVAQNLMHQWKEPFGYVEVNNTLAVAGESMDREAAQGAHQVSLSQKVTLGAGSLT